MFQFILLNFISFLLRKSSRWKITHHLVIDWITHFKNERWLTELHSHPTPARESNISLSTLFEWAEGWFGKTSKPSKPSKQENKEKQKQQKPKEEMLDEDEQLRLKGKDVCFYSITLFQKITRISFWKKHELFYFILLKFS